MKTRLTRLAALFTDQLLCLLVSFMTGIRPARAQALPWGESPTVYYANHSSHGDFMLVWVSLPSEQRMMTRPVAGADYWLKTRLRRFIGEQVFSAVMIARQGGQAESVVAQLSQVLRGGQSLIVFPEGTRNTTDDTPLLPFKSGIYHLAAENPGLRFVPVWIHNINRVLPKGKWLPVPLLCSVHIGAPLALQDSESKEDFLARSRHALLALAPATEVAS